MSSDEERTGRCSNLLMMAALEGSVTDLSKEEDENDEVRMSEQALQGTALADLVKSCPGTPSFINSPFSSKVDYEAWLQLPPTERDPVDQAAQHFSSVRLATLIPEYTSADGLTGPDIGSAMPVAASSCSEFRTVCGVRATDAHATADASAALVACCDGDEFDAPFLQCFNPEMDGTEIGQCSARSGAAARPSSSISDALVADRVKQEMRQRANRNQASRGRKGSRNEPKDRDKRKLAASTKREVTSFSGF
mmetsp:Transcript_11758/g.19792  ORF Transcript_11758/g.19792 Transcript_11758/m.19792 type:complete len:251 (+) Transcript_11758:278-1030(+)